MNKRGRVDEIFNIDIKPLETSTHSDVHSTDSRLPLTGLELSGDELPTLEDQDNASRIMDAAQFFPSKIVTIDHGDIITAVKLDCEHSSSSNVRIKQLNYSS